MCGTQVEVLNSRPGASRKKWCETCKTHPMRDQFRQQIYKHNITISECERLYSITECQCCGKTLADGGGPGKAGRTNRQIDHCHNTNIIRGVLCWDCNVGIGKLGDNIEGVRQALDYLERIEK